MQELALLVEANPSGCRPHAHAGDAGHLLIQPLMGVGVKPLTAAMDVQAGEVLQYHANIMEQVLAQLPGVQLTFKDTDIQDYEVLRTLLDAPSMDIMMPHLLEHHIQMSRLRHASNRAYFCHAWDEQLYASGPVSVAVEAYTWHESKRELARKVHARHGNGEGHRPRSRSPAGPVVQRAVDTARVEPGGAETGGAETGGAETGGAETGGAAVRSPPPPPPPPAETRGRCGLMRTMAKAPPSRRRHHLMWSRHWCPAGHALVRDRAPVDGCWCDRCSATVNRGGVLHGCRRCNFDLCGQCGGGSQEASRMVRVPLHDPPAMPPPPPPPPPPLFTFLTVIDKQGFESFRMLVEECDQPAPGHPEGFKILAFYSDGALAAHNNQQGAVRIEAGDVIMSVNGTSDRGVMLQELVQSRVCRLSIIRPFNSLEAPAPHAMTSLLRQRLSWGDSEANSEEPEVRGEGGRDWFI